MSLIPPRHRPAAQPGPIDDPIVAREIARAQRIVEGQNFEIRRTLWKYSALVEEQRRIVCEWRQSLLAGEADPGICAESCPEHYAALTAAAGADAVRHAEQSIVVRMLDERWADHLAFIEDVREGIHLQRYAGREPIMEFHRQIVAGFESLMADVRTETAARFARLRLAGGTIDLHVGRARGLVVHVDLPRERQPVLHAGTVDARQPQHRRRRGHGHARDALPADLRRLSPGRCS